VAQYHLQTKSCEFGHVTNKRNGTFEKRSPESAMSIFPFQFINDLMPSASSSEDDVAGDVLSAEGSVYSDSVMMSGISTDPTTALTLPGDAASIQTTDSPAAPVYGDHGAVTGLRPGTFIEIYREHLARNVQSQNSDDETDISEFGGTIISSAPSGTEIEPPPLHESWHITSYPRPIHRDNLSISTTESMYRDLVSLRNDDQEEDHSSSGIITDASPLSLHPSMIESTVPSNSDAHVSSPSSPWERHHRQSTTRHERDSFVNVADRLERQSHHPKDTNSCEWFVRFTEQDWLAFRRDADMILAALKESGDEDGNLPFMPPPLPPPLPPGDVQGLLGGPDTVIPSYCAAEALPNSFICILCDDVIVGSTTLDCCCAKSAVCTSCWEDKHTSVSLEEDDDELEDLVHVVHHNHDMKTCSFCTKPVIRAMPCHALDVAILHCVQALPEDHHPVKLAYYRRLTAWRLEVERRRSECQLRNIHQQRDTFLAELIEEEEKYFWKKEQPKSFWQTNKHLFVVFAELALVASAAAFHGGGVMRGTLIMRR
jgi:hypothetical protein